MPIGICCLESKIRGEIGTYTIHINGPGKDADVCPFISNMPDRIDMLLCGPAPFPNFIQHGMLFSDSLLRPQTKYYKVGTFAMPSCKRHSTNGPWGKETGGLYDRCRTSIHDVFPIGDAVALSLSILANKWRYQHFGRHPNSLRKQW